MSAAPSASPDRPRRPPRARLRRRQAPAAAPVKPKAAPAARPAPKPHAPGDVEVEPIACWWKTDRNAVNIGERFTVTLTCSVVETTAVKVVPDLNQLEPTTVALQPFEVVKGVRHEDIRTPPLRYIQYEYTTRLIGDVFFGKDVDIPSVKITYHIQSAIGGGSQGRDQTYALPALRDAGQLARAEEGRGHPRQHAPIRSPRSNRAV